MECAEKCSQACPWSALFLPHQGRPRPVLHETRARCVLLIPSPIYSSNEAFKAEAQILLDLDH